MPKLAKLNIDMPFPPRLDTLDMIFGTGPAPKKRDRRNNLAIAVQVIALAHALDAAGWEDVYDSSLADMFREAAELSGAFD